MSDIKTETVPVKKRRRWLRILLLLVVPVAAAAGGLEIYLNGGRYITTDNAYVAAQKVLVTPEVSGTVDSIAVTEGQKLKAGDVVFTLDRKPFELALASAEVAVARAESDFNGLTVKLSGLAPQITLARETVSMREAELARKEPLAAKHLVADTAIEDDRIALQQARAALEVLEQQRRDIISGLGGREDAQLDGYAPWTAAKATAAQAQWQLDQTVLRAPLDGIATQVANIQMGRYLPAGTAVFAIVATDRLWIDANPKETDITWLTPGQQVAITVDAFPDKTFEGTVETISPGTGSQFSLIPAQNAAGNWVKVVQRVPVRIAFASNQGTEQLRAGMSVQVAIDTRRQRSLAQLLGMNAVAGTAEP